MELVALYVFQHLFSLLLLVKRLSFWYALLSILVITFIHLIKPDTYDILAYTQLMDDPFALEIGYALLSMFSKLILRDNRGALYLVQIILALLFLSLSLQVKNKYRNTNYFVISSVIIASSVAFYLGINNAIRQGFSSILLIWSFYFFTNNKIFRSLLFLILAQSFHSSSVIFYLLFLSIYLTYTTLIHTRINVFNFFKLLIPKKFSINFIKVVAVPFVLFMAIIALYILLFKFNIYTGYGDKVLTQGGERPPAFLRLAPITISFLITEIYLGKYDECKINFFNVLRLLRWSLVLFMLFLLHNIQFDELISRVLYFFMCIDCAMLVHAWNTKKHRKVVVFTLLTYAFATNVWNILSRGG